MGVADRNAIKVDAKKSQKKKLSVFFPVHLERRKIDSLRVSMSVCSRDTVSHGVLMIFKYFRVLLAAQRDPRIHTLQYIEPLQSTQFRAEQRKSLGMCV